MNPPKPKNLALALTAIRDYCAEINGGARKPEKDEFPLRCVQSVATRALAGLWEPAGIDEEKLADELFDET